MKAELYPLVMSPSFRSGEETPWGGNALKEKYGKDAPAGITGESLEISVLPGLESCVANGPFAGWSLTELLPLWQEKLTGSSKRNFPLLLKLLDARQPLSVQVHPGDDYALANEGKPGKSEAWYILDAEPGAKLVYGLDSRGKDLRDILESGRLESFLHWADVHPGDVFHIPAGTVHALGPGIQCYEIQQSSDVTYRLWDWGRTGKDGRPRKLHIRQGLSVAKAGSAPVRKAQIIKQHAGGTGTLLVDDPHFQLYALDLQGSYPLPAGRMLFLTAVAACSVFWEHGSQQIAPFRSVLIPAGLRNVTVSGSGRVLAAVAL